MDHRALAGIELPRVQGGQDRLDRQVVGLDHGPATTKACAQPVHVVGGDGRQAAPFVQRHVGQIPAVAAHLPDFGAVVVDFDCVDHGEAAHVLGLQREPAGMGESEKRPRGDGAGADRFGGLAVGRGPEVPWQSNGHDVPELAIGQTALVQLGPRKSDEIGRAASPRVGDRMPVIGQEMVGHGDEIITFARIRGAGLGHRMISVRLRGVHVQIAAPEPSRCRKRQLPFDQVRHHCSAHLLSCPPAVSTGARCHKSIIHWRYRSHGNAGQSIRRMMKF